MFRLGVVFLCVTLITCSNGATYIWNNATGGIWTDTRWQIDGTGPLVCCPGASDLAVVNASAGLGKAYMVRSLNTFEVGSLEAGPIAEGLAGVLLYGLTGQFLARNSLIVRTGVYLQILAAVTIPAQSINKILDNGNLLINAADIKCDTPGECTLDINGGSLLTIDAGGKGWFSHMKININIAPLILNMMSQSEISFINSTLSIFGLEVHILSGRFTMGLTGSSDLRLVFLRLEKDPTDFSYFAWASNAVGTVSNSQILVNGGKILVDNSEVSFIGGEQWSQFSISDDGSVYSQFGARTRIRDWSPITMQTGNLATVQFGTMHISDSTIFARDASFISATENSYLWITNSTIQFSNGSGLAIRDSIAIISAQMLFDENSGLICRDSYVELENTQLDNEAGLFNCTLLVLQNLEGSSSYFNSFNSTVEVNGNASLSSSGYAQFADGVVNVTGSFKLIDSYVLTVNSTFYLNGGLGFGNCTQNNVSWYLYGNGERGVSCGALFQLTRLEVAGQLEMAANSSIMILYSSLNLAGTLKAESGSLVRTSRSHNISVSGLMHLRDAHFYSAKDVFLLDGGLVVENCLAPPEGFWDDTERVVNPRLHRSCVTLFDQSDVRSKGSMSFATNSSTVFIEATASINGTMSIGSHALFIVSDSEFDVFGEISVGQRAAIYMTANRVNFNSGIVSVQVDANWEFVRSDVKLQGSTLDLAAGAFIWAKHSRVEISAGQMALRGIGQFYEFLYCGLMSVDASEIIISGGAQLAVESGARIGAVYNASMTINGGFLAVANGGRIEVSDDANFTINGGSVALNYANFSLSNHALGIVAGGNVHLRNSSEFEIYNSSRMIVEGSIFLEDSMIVMKDSALEISQGAIVMDSASLVTLTGSSIIGVGSINGSVVLIDSKITYAGISSTQLVVGSLRQSNGSVMEVNLSSNYTSGTSTTIHSNRGVNVTGTVVITVDLNMAQRLRNGERIALITSDEYVEGSFTSTVFDGSSTLTCGMTLNTTAKALSVLFDSRKCSSEGSTPSTSEVGINVAGLAAGLVVAIIAVVVIVVIVLIFKVPAFKSAVMPWRHLNKPAASTATQAENYDDVEEDEKRPKSSKSAWTEGRVTRNL